MVVTEVQELNNITMRFVSIDPSLTHTGIVWGEIKDNKIHTDGMMLLETEKTKNKQVRASSDTIDRCRYTYNNLMNLINNIQPQVIFVETPSGSQSSDGMKSYGAVCQLIATLNPIPIEVTPTEVKMATVGNKTASKLDMIKWAYDRFEINWFRSTKGFKMHDGEILAHKNEHIADACCIAVAGMQTRQYNQIAHII